MILINIKFYSMKCYNIFMYTTIQKFTQIVTKQLDKRQHDQSVWMHINNINKKNVISMQ